MTSSKEKNVGKTILKVIGIISTILIGLTIIISVLLLTVLEPYSESFLKNKVSESTEGLYELELDDLDINLLALTVRLKDIHLKYDSAVHQELKKKGKASPFLISLTTKELEISGINVLDYLFSSSIDILSIKIDHPNAKIFHDEDVPKQKKKQQQKISEIINSIKLGRFTLADASLSYFNYAEQTEVVHKIPQLNIQLSDFTADSLDRKDIRKMVDMKDLLITLKNQSFETSNKSYTFYFDLFRYSMAEEELTIKSFSAIGDHSKMSKPMIVPEIRLPLFKLFGLDLMKALKTRKLYLKELLIDSTYVKLLEIPDLDVTVEDVYRGVAPFFETTKIDHLNIDRSAVSMYSRQNRDMLIQKIEKIDLSIEDVFFDSLSVFDSRNNLALQDLELKIENYLFTPENNPYTFKLGRMEMRTKEDFLILRDFALIPDIEQNKALGYQSGQASAKLINIDIPEISFEGIDMIRAFEHSNLDIFKIAIPGSDISVSKAFEQSSSGSGFSPEAMYESFSFYVKQINIHNFLVGNTDLTIYQSEQKELKQHQAQNAELRLTEIHFDSLMAYQSKRKAPLKELAFGLHRYSYQSPDSSFFLETGPIEYKNENFGINHIQLKNFSTQNGLEKDSLTASLKNLSIANIDLVEAFNKSKLEIEEILIQQPDLFVSREIKKDTSSSDKNKEAQELPGKSIFNFLNPITVNAIRIEKGEAKYAERLQHVTNFQKLKNFTIEVQKLNLSPKSIKNIEETIPVENILINAENYTFNFPDSIYTITLDSLFYTSKNTNLIAKQFQMSPDYQLHKYRVQDDIKNAHRNLFEISTNQFSISNIDLIDAYKTGNYRFGEVLLKSPELTILQDKNVVNSKQEEDSKSSNQEGQETDKSNGETLSASMQQQINEYIDVFTIDSLNIEDARFSFDILKNGSIRQSQDLEHLSLLIESIRLKSLDANDLTDLLAVDDISLLLQDYSFVMPDSLYKLRVKQLRASLAKKFIRIDSVNFEPLFLIDEYADKLDYAQDRFDLKANNINLEGISFYEFFNYQNYIVEKLEIDGFNGNIYRDSRVEQSPNRAPRTVQQLVKDLPIPIHLDTLNLKNASIIYSEVSKEGSRPGITALTDTDIQITNITNDSIAYTVNDKMKASAVTSFLGDSKLKVNFVFDMTHPDDLYTYEGHLEHMKFQDFNPLFTNLLFVKMESGEIEKIDFSVTATKHKSVGMMKFPYENLEFKILNKDDPGNPGFWLKATNWTLNNLVIKSNNPGKLFNSYREGKIAVDRNYSKSVFNHMGNSLLSGLISSTIPEPLESILDWFTDLP
ncbi:hypothetical protein GCM10011506_35500 [Marivirga lumbricoides]|uniref:AsmA-like C-terminal domain-containing protein n=1 Tax=Marivirga lumbricoides TaxID=1046115 RepID=A0ABQ1MUH8_9BACT|nr:hypothetical protein GCM10011506_35500 [Marivirga lumbricoides]